MLAATSTGGFTENIVELIMFAIFIFIPVKPLTCRIDFLIQTGFLARQKTRTLAQRRNNDSKSSEYNREEEM